MLLPGWQLADMNSLEQAEGNTHMERLFFDDLSLPTTVQFNMFTLEPKEAKNPEF